jgi:hypothetical protein
MARGTAAPVTGYWNRGDMVRNSAPNASDSVWAWICTNSGAPGTWQPLTMDGTFPLLAGRAGGTTMYGGTGSGDHLRLYSTSHATKGRHYLTPTTYYDEANKKLVMEVDLGVDVNYSKSLQAGASAIGIANAFTSAGILTETVEINFFYGTSLAASIVIGKEEDFTTGANRTAYMALNVRKDGTTTEMLRLSGNNNTVQISNARLLGVKGADVVSANDITLGNGNHFQITGTTQINRILTTNWTAGSSIVLKFSASVTVAHQGAANGSSFARINLAGAANFSATANDTLTLIYDGTDWFETARAVI